MAYTLLEEQPGQNRSSRRKGLAVLAGSIALLLIASTVYITQHSTTDDRNAFIVNDTVPVRALSFKVPTQTNQYHVDLDKYPIEDNLIKVFATKAINDSIQQVTIDRLLQQYHNDSAKTPWSTKWLRNDNPSDKNTYACDQQPLPYPLLRYLATEYFPLTNADDFYDAPVSFNSSAFMLLPYGKSLDFSQGHQLCVRVVVPFGNVGKDDVHRYLYQPFSENSAQLTSPWWDTMMVSLTEISTNATIPIHMNPWSGHRNLRQRARELNNANFQMPEWARLRDDQLYERERMHVYEAQIDLPQQGIYQLSGILEFVEGRYNFEKGPLTEYTPVHLPVYPAGLENITIVDNGQVQEKTDLQLLREHLALPLCKGMNATGRWLPFPKEGGDVSRISGVTRDGKYWAPYSCRYRHMSYEKFNRCVSRVYPNGMNIFGDSNMRRSIKKFLSHGQWCKDWEKYLEEPLLPEDKEPVVGNNTLHFLRRDQLGYNSPEEYTFVEKEQTRSCYCEDYREPHWNGSWFESTQRRFNMTFANSQKQIDGLGVTEWDNSNRTAINMQNPDAFNVSSYKWDGLTYLNNPQWDTAVPGSPADANIAIFSLGNWDTAFSELEPFLRDVDDLIRQIKAHYSLDKTKIIFRSSQYYCCRVDTDTRQTRQVNQPRMEVFEHEARTRFERELKAQVWDTYSLGESKTWEEKLIGITCPSNHVPADQVEIENQVLMNGLCNL